MKIPSEDVPQADKLEDVVKVIEGVGQGARTFQDLSRYIDKVERQGRYYRRAAEILGFIKNQTNHAILTKLGENYLSSSPVRKEEILARAVLSCRMMQRLIPFLEGRRAAGVTKQEVEEFIKTVAEETGPSMIPRRASSAIAWLSDIGLLNQRGSKFVLGNLPESVEFIDYTAEDEPLFPKKYDLNEYQDLSSEISQNTKSVSVLINDAQKDRALKSHRMLTNLMAAKIRKAGAIPKRNPYIDLSARIDEQIYLFEMKSSNDGNAHDQIRKGISQLYEYRYIQRADEARLILVVENPLPAKLRWLENYLIEDRGIFLVWDGNRKTFNCPKNERESLPFIF